MIRQPLPLTAVLFLGLTLAPTAQSVARDLTFEDRVKAQEAIERVYYSHQIGATKPFQQAVPHSILEKKVRTYLKESVALERVWFTPITPDMLHREMERIMRDTQRPDRLQEIFAALGYDSFVIEECLARATLTDRLTRSFFITDGQIHAAARAEALGLQSRLVRGLLSTTSDDSRRDVVEVYQAPPTDPTHGEVDPVGIEPRPSGLSRLRVTADEYETWRSRAPAHIGEIGRVIEEPGQFVIRVALSEEAESFQLATYRIQKTPWDDWWQASQGRFDEGSLRTVAEGTPFPTMLAEALTGDVLSGVESRR